MKDPITSSVLLLLLQSFHSNVFRAVLSSLIFAKFSRIPQVLFIHGDQSNPCNLLGLLPFLRFGFHVTFLTGKKRKGKADLQWKCGGPFGSPENNLWSSLSTHFVLSSLPKSPPLPGSVWTRLRSPHFQIGLFQRRRLAVGSSRGISVIKGHSIRWAFLVACNKSLSSHPRPMKLKIIKKKSKNIFIEKERKIRLRSMWRGAAWVPRQRGPHLRWRGKSGCCWASSFCR